MKYKAKVSDIIEWLQQYNPNAVVQFACTFGDKPRYWISDYTQKPDEDPKKTKLVYVDIV